MIAYHFLREDMTAGSGEEVAWSVGEERTIEGDLALCDRGYHSAPSWWDALQYAPGPVACIVEITKPEAKDESKQVSRTRKLIAAKNVSKELRLFACDQAEAALKQANVTDEVPWSTIEIARRFAEGMATSEELASARTSSSAWASASVASGTPNSSYRRITGTSSPRVDAISPRWRMVETCWAEGLKLRTMELMGMM